jgi:hypothetical protein
MTYSEALHCGCNVSNLVTSKADLPLASVLVVPANVTLWFAAYLSRSAVPVTVVFAPVFIAMHRGRKTGGRVSVSEVVNQVVEELRPKLERELERS